MRFCHIASERSSANAFDEFGAVLWTRCGCRIRKILKGWSEMHAPFSAHSIPKCSALEILQNVRDRPPSQRFLNTGFQPAALESAPAVLIRCLTARPRRGTASVRGGAAERCRSVRPRSARETRAVRAFVAAAPPATPVRSATETCPRASTPTRWNTRDCRSVAEPAAWKSAAGRASPPRHSCLWIFASNPPERAQSEGREKTERNSCSVSCQVRSGQVLRVTCLLFKRRGLRLIDFLFLIGA